MAAISSASRTVQSSGGAYHAARASPAHAHDRRSGRACTSVRHRTALRLRAGPKVFCDQILHGRVVERELGVHPLELLILRLELSDPPQLGGLQTSVLALPLVVRRRADADLAADVVDGMPASACFSVATICVSVNLDVRMEPPGLEAVPEDPLMRYLSDREAYAGSG